MLFSQYFERTVFPILQLAVFFGNKAIFKAINNLFRLGYNKNIANNIALLPKKIANCNIEKAYSYQILQFSKYCENCNSSLPYCCFRFLQTKSLLGMTPAAIFSVPKENSEKCSLHNIEKLQVLDCLHGAISALVINEVEILI